MLEYEKRLRLDEKWEKLKSRSINGKIFKFIFSTLLYSISYFILRLVAKGIPDIKSWNQGVEWMNVLGIPLLISDLIFFIGGLTLFLLGSIRLAAITTQNHKVKGADDEPTALLCTGYYSLVRHPMYGAFVICYAGIWLSLRSLIGMAVFIVFTIIQYFNAKHEERKRLIPKFGATYLDYIRSVPRRLLQIYEIILLSGIIALVVIGFFVR